MRITDRQGEILDFIRSEIRDNGLPPTRAEICIRFGFKSPNAAECHLRALRRLGFIEQVPAIARGIRLACP